jgi:hypothetical protein
MAAGTDDSYVTLVSLRYDISSSPMDSGASQLWRASDSDITVTGSVDDEVTVEVDDGESSPAATLSFAAPTGQTLTPGTYDDAQRTADRTGNHPGVRFGGDDTCQQETGRFTVFDVSPDLSRLHLTYEMHCNGDDDAVIGEVRIGEPSDGSGLLVAPDHIGWPATYPGIDSRKVPVTLINTGADPVTLDSATVTAGAPAFAVTDNPCSTIAPGESCKLYVRFSPTSAGDESGRLTLHDSTSAGQHVVQLAGTGIAGHTSWRMNSDPGDWIGDGHSWSYSPANSFFTAEGNETHVRLTTRGDTDWSADFSADAGQALLPGSTFKAARDFPFNGSAPGMDVSGDGRGCNSIDGTFTVQQAEYADNGDVKAFAATFEQHCEGDAPALFGSIAWKAPSSPATVPYGNTTSPVAQLQALPSTQSAVLSWSNPTEVYWDHTIVRRARGTHAPSTVRDGTLEYSGRANVLVSRHLRPNWAYSWTLWPVYGSGALGPARHITLRGSTLTGHVSPVRTGPDGEATFWCRLVDPKTGRGVKDQNVDIYHRVRGGGWKWLSSETTNSHGRAYRRYQIVFRTTLYKAVYDGDGNHLGSSSDPVVIKPVKR